MLLLLVLALPLLGQTPGYPVAPPQAHATIRRLRALERSGTALTLAQRVELAMSYHAAGQHLLFRGFLEQCREQHPEEPEVPFLLARHYGSDVQDWGKAVRYFREALELRRDGRTLAYLANALETSGKPEEALPYYREAIRLTACQPLALTGLARLHEVTPDAILACQPHDPNLLTETAKLLVAAGRLADAVAALERAAVAAPHDPAIAYRLYRAYQDAGSAAKAKAALDRYRELRSIYGNR
ncbi:MAG: tetratricopeptide repeat protein [Bryobacterales bacterium]|nr:tetratricopeptide repeat protein [Bryobacterales bacterium]